MLYPRLTLIPNQTKINITDYISSWMFGLYAQYIPNSINELYQDCYTIKNLFKGKYVLLIEYSYRRHSDFVQISDTLFLNLSLNFQAHSKVINEVGGYKIISRINDYLKHGPQLSINANKQNYFVFKHKITNPPEEIFSIPRSY